MCAFSLELSVFTYALAPHNVEMTAYDIYTLSLILLLYLPLIFFSACSLRNDFNGTTVRLCPMYGEGPFHCIPDVDDDCISDFQVKTHGALLFSSTTTVFINKHHLYKMKRE